MRFSKDDFDQTDLDDFASFDGGYDTVPPSQKNFQSVDMNMKGTFQNLTRVLAQLEVVNKTIFKLFPSGKKKELDPLNMSDAAKQAIVDQRISERIPVNVNAKLSEEDSQKLLELQKLIDPLLEVSVGISAGNKLSQQEADETLEELHKVSKELDSIPTAIKSLDISETVSEVVSSVEDFVKRDVGKEEGKQAVVNLLSELKAQNIISNSKIKSLMEMLNKDASAKGMSRLFNLLKEPTFEQKSMTTSLKRIETTFGNGKGFEDQLAGTFKKASQEGSESFFREYADDVIRTAQSTAKEGTKAGVQGLIGAFGGPLGMVLDEATGFSDKFADMGEALMSKGLSSIQKTAKDIFKASEKNTEAVQSIASAVQEGMSENIDELRSVSDSFSEEVEGIEGKSRFTLFNMQRSLTRNFSKAYEGVSKGLKGAFSGVGKLFKGGEKGGFLSTIMGLPMMLQSFFGKGGAIAGILAKLGGKAGIFAKLGSLGKFATKGIPLIGGVIAAGSKLLSGGSMSEAAGSGLGAAAGTAAGAALGTMLLPGIGTWIGGLLGGLAGEKLGSEFLPILFEAMQPLWDAVKEVFEVLKGSVSDIFTAVTDVLKSLWDVLGPVVGILFKVLVPLVKAGFIPLVWSFKLLALAIKGVALIIKGLVWLIVEPFKALASGLKILADGVTSLFDMVVSGVTDLLEPVIKFIQECMVGVKKWVKSLYDWVPFLGDDDEKVSSDIDKANEQIKAKKAKLGKVATTPELTSAQSGVYHGSVGTGITSEATFSQPEADYTNTAIQRDKRQMENFQTATSKGMQSAAPQIAAASMPSSVKKTTQQVGAPARGSSDKPAPLLFDDLGLIMVNSGIF